MGPRTLRAPGGRVFVGHWEDVPDQTAPTYDFHPAALPSWLSEALPQG
jgi:hypothetical protein